jgi:hypothetical protein
MIIRKLSYIHAQFGKEAGNGDSTRIKKTLLQYLHISLTGMATIHIGKSHYRKNVKIGGLYSVRGRRQEAEKQQEI